MNDAVVAALRCPLCADGLAATPGSLRCPHGHSFDVARAGYAHLGVGRRLPAGDTPEMVAARAGFLHHYLPVRAAVADAVPGGAALVADAGAGTGFYLSGALDAAPDAAGLAMDVSKAALRRAARCHPRAAAVLTDLWGPLPLRDSAVDVLLNVFAPRNGPEYARILTPRGRLVVVTPLADHLSELRAAHGLLDVDPAKEERLATSLSAFQATASEDLTWPMSLTAEDVTAVVGMGPNAFHTQTRAYEPTTVTAAIRVTTYMKG
ncbi:putative RNA methyltransferase [Hamadaea tsunoensis]|uniref:putative RNA methyltransferase n=1 Tax=Hamadaea tsunoensis TaxID=53368 RepID=UPI000403E6CB|nr:hypothetical protein [Hamadaea tsunoensis]